MLDFQINYSLAELETILGIYLSLNFSPDDQLKIQNCVSLVKTLHAGQKRDDSSDYTTHLLRVALMIGLYETPCINLLLAGLLHDTLEDTNYAVDEMRRDYSDIIVSYVEGVTSKSVSGETFEERRHRKMKKWHQTMNAPHDIRVIKTFDSLDNLIALKFMTPDQDGFQKISRWLMQAQDMKLPLAEKTNRTAYHMMLQELAFYKDRGDVAGSWLSV